MKDNKNQSKFIVDVNSLRAKYPRTEFNPVRDSLRESGCDVTLDDRGGRRFMRICGNISESAVISEFKKRGINVSEHLVTPRDWREGFRGAVNERRKPCCPAGGKGAGSAAGVKSAKYMSLKECLSGKGITAKKGTGSEADINRVIDIVSGKTLNESVVDMAMRKMDESARGFDRLRKLAESMDPDTYVKVVESARANAKSLYSNVVINKKKLSEYSLSEIEKMYKKVYEQIAGLSKKVAMNESGNIDALRLQLDEKKRLQKILEEEMSYRRTLAKINEGDDDSADAIEFKDLNPGADDADKSSDDKEDADNPDEDEVEELSKIIITLANEEAANNLRDDLVDAGVPEDVIEIEAAGDESDDDDADEDEDGADDLTGFEEESDDELNDIFSDADAKAEESAKPKKSKNEEAEAINEDDDADASDEGDADSDDADEASDDADDSDDADKQYNLILIDTDYVDTFKNVLIDLWGVTEDEFVEMVGEIVLADDDDASEDNSDDDADKSDDEKKENKKEDKKEDKKDDKEDELDFNPDDIFKGL